MKVDQVLKTMKRIHLKFAIPEFGGTLYEVGLKVLHEEEEPVVKHPHKPNGNTGQAASEAQIAQRQRFKRAVAYARTVLANPQLRLYYADMARRRGKSPWGAAVSDSIRGNDLLAKK